MTTTYERDTHCAAEWRFNKLSTFCGPAVQTLRLSFLWHTPRQSPLSPRFIIVGNAPCPGVNDTTLTALQGAPHPHTHNIQHEFLGRALLLSLSFLSQTHHKSCGGIFFHLLLPSGIILFVLFSVVILGSRYCLMDGSTGGQSVIAVRIKDGIFVGNVTAAHDEDFLFMNKVVGIVNCAGSEVKDLYEGTIQYLTFPWRDSGTNCSTVLFDSADRNIEQIVRFIDKCTEGGECVLVQSYFGISRSCAIVIAYLMVKYGWNLETAENFVKMAHADMNIKPYFLRQLKTFSRRHAVPYDVFDTSVDDGTFALDNDQWMLRNTYVNGLTHDVQSKHPLFIQSTAEIKVHESTYKPNAKRRRRIVFCDTRQGSTVSSTATQPILSTRFVDPVTGTRVTNGGGGGGTSLMGPDAAPPSILARRGSINTRRHESPPEVNAKGRQVLVLRQSKNEAGGQTQQQQNSGSQQQQPASRDQFQYHEQQQYSQRSTGAAGDDRTPTNNTSAYGGASHTGGGGGGGASPHHHAGNATGVSGSGQSIVLRGVAAATVSAAQPTSLQPSSPMAMRGGPLSAAYAAAAQGGGPLSSVPNGSATIVSARSSLAPGPTKLASPFAALTSQGTVRKGSPLPVNRNSAASAQSAAGQQSSASGGGRYATAQMVAASSPSGGLLPASAVQGGSGRSTPQPQPRASSPMAQASQLSTLPMHPAVQASNGPRGSSPLGRLAPAAVSASPAHTLQAPRSSPTPVSASNSGSSAQYYGSSSGGGGSQFYIPNAAASVTAYHSAYSNGQSNNNNGYTFGNASNSPRGMVAATPLLAAHQGAPASSGMRTSSPQAQPRTASGSVALQPTARSQPAAISAVAAVRTSSPVGMRVSAAPTVVTASAGRVASSPRSLAEQYLGSNSGGRQGVGAPPVAQATSSQRGRPGVVAYR